MSHTDETPWDSDGELPWERASGAWEPEDSEAWRGDLHVNDWPENLAGPEYWLYKQENEDE